MRARHAVSKRPLPAIAISLIAVVLLASAASGQDLSMASLTLLFRDTLGNPVPPGVLTVLPVEGAAIYSGSVSSGANIHLPPGRYTFIFKTKFFQDSKREVTIDGQDVLITMTVRSDDYVLDMPMNKPVSVSFKITNAKSCSAADMLTAKMTAVFSDTTYERRLMPGGYLLFEPVEVGTYILVVLDGKEVRALRAITTNGPLTTGELSLAACR